VRESYPDLVNAVLAVKRFEAAIVDPTIKFSTWLFVKSGNPNTCKKCDNYGGDTYDLEDPDDLLEQVFLPKNLKPFPFVSVLFNTFPYFFIRI
jgi:hypothetical protein